VGLIAGIGFTVSLFIADLAFTDPALVAEAKIAILGASVLMAAVGLAYLFILTKPRPGTLATVQPDG
jgi:NhaA family Na+:H+ antiporter